MTTSFNTSYNTTLPLEPILWKGEPTDSACLKHQPSGHSSQSVNLLDTDTGELCEGLTGNMRLLSCLCGERDQPRRLGVLLVNGPTKDLTVTIVPPCFEHFTSDISLPKFLKSASAAQ